MQMIPKKPSKMSVITPTTVRNSSVSLTQKDDKDDHCKQHDSSIVIHDIEPDLTPSIRNPTQTLLSESMVKSSRNRQF